VGPADGPALFIVSSGTHGPEGFAGSGCQHALLHDDLLKRAEDRGVAVLMIHAVNSYGFSHLRRTNEDNVDLNRNFHDFAEPYPANPVYEELHSLLVPATWPPDPAGEERLQKAAASFASQTPGLSSGQNNHPDGLFYCGTGPSFSNRTIRAILQKHARHRRHVAWIDVHTGLGPYGHGEKIFGHHDAETEARALAWWGRDLMIARLAQTASPKTFGHIVNAARQECPNVALTPMTLEYGTVPTMDVMNALRGEAWLAGHPDAPAERARALRKAIRDAFYIDADDWKGMILGQFRALALQTINGLAGTVGLPSGTAQPKS
jgi:predicted deacylase